MHALSSQAPSLAAWRAAVTPFLTPELVRLVRMLDDDVAACAVELRVRRRLPLLLVTSRGEVWLDPDGRPCSDPKAAFHPDDRVMEALFDRITGGSAYSVQERIRQGFLTLPGGHRVGLAGRLVTDAGSSVRALVEVSSFNVRIARAVPGAARPVVTQIARRTPDGRLRLASTLVISPPGAGKTTLLRDLARLASSGVAEIGLPGSQVVVVDERSEIAGTCMGVAQHDLGPRTDVLDASPRAEGIVWALRALNPSVLVMDEIGTPSDVEAVFRAAHAGCSILASAHADGLVEARRRSGLAQLIDDGVFERAVVLSSRQGPGTVEGVLPVR